VGICYFEWVIALHLKLNGYEGLRSQRFQVQPIKCHFDLVLLGERDFTMIMTEVKNTFYFFSVIFMC
jgi:hypothetical protein